MNKLSMVMVFGVLASVVACAAPATEEEDGAESGEALSAKTCTPRAEAAKQKAITSCKAANGSSDRAACMKPADDAFAAYTSQMEAAYNRNKSVVDSITADCKEDVDAMSADALVNAAMPRASDYAKASAKSNAQQMANLRKARRAQCDVDARADLQARLGADNELVVLSNQGLAKNAAWAAGWSKCAAQGASAWVADAMCTGELEYQQTFSTCRKECGKVPTQACVPSGYDSPNVRCGKLVAKKGFSLRAGITCEEATTCERTAVCDKFDELMDGGAGQECMDNGKAGTLVPTIYLAQGTGAASRAALVCKTN